MSEIDLETKVGSLGMFDLSDSECTVDEEDEVVACKSELEDGKGRIEFEIPISYFREEIVREP